MTAASLTPAPATRRSLTLLVLTGSLPVLTSREGGNRPSLRAEMLQKIDLHNKLPLFTYTPTAALLGVAATMDDTCVCLVPIPVVLLISLRIAYYRDATAKLAALLATD